MALFLELGGLDWSTSKVPNASPGGPRGRHFVPKPPPQQQPDCHVIVYIGSKEDVAFKQFILLFHAELQHARSSTDNWAEPTQSNYVKRKCAKAYLDVREQVIT